MTSLSSTLKDCSIQQLRVSMLYVDRWTHMAYHEGYYHQGCHWKCFNWYAANQLGQNCSNKQLIEQHVRESAWPERGKLTYVVIEHLRQGVRTIPMDASSFSSQLHNILVLRCTACTVKSQHNFWELSTNIYLPCHCHL